MNAITDFILSTEGILTILLLVVSLGSIYFVNYLESRTTYWREEYWKECKEVYKYIGEVVKAKEEIVSSLDDNILGIKRLQAKHIEIVLKLNYEKDLLKKQCVKNRSKFNTLPSYRGKKNVGRKHRQSRR